MQNCLIQCKEASMDFNVFRTRVFVAVLGVKQI